MIEALRRIRQYIRQTSWQPALAVDNNVDRFVLEKGIAVPGGTETA